MCNIENISIERKYDSVVLGYLNKSFKRPIKSTNKRSHDKKKC